MSLLGVACLGYGLFGLSASTLRGGPFLIWGAVLFPAVVLGSLALTMPALYIFSAFGGTRFHPRQIAMLSLFALVVPGVLLAGMAPIHWFLAVSTRSLPVVWIGNVLALVSIGFLAVREVKQLWPHLEQQQERVLCNPATEHPQNTDSSAAMNAIPEPVVKIPTLLLHLWMFLYIGMLFKCMTIATSWTGLLLWK